MNVPPRPDLPSVDRYDRLLLVVVVAMVAYLLGSIPGA